MTYRDANLLIEFLNFDSSQCARLRLSGDEWALSLPPMFQALFGHRLKSSRQLPRLLKEIDAIRDEMKKDLAGLYSEDPQPHLERVIKKINGMNLHARFALIHVQEDWPREQKPSAVVAHHGAVFELAGRPFSVVFDRLQLDVSLGREWYLVLATVLERSELERVGHCPQCGTFFLRKDLKARFCSNSCRYRYSNEQRQKAGYFKDWHQGEKNARQKAKKG